MFDNVVVIVRSAYERTESLCTHLVQAQVPSNRIVVIHERPFTAALRKAYEIGIEAALDWTLCIDADVLIRKGAIAELLNHAAALPDEVLGASGHVFYKFRAGADQGGLHLYRTSMLPDALRFVPDSQNSGQARGTASHETPEESVELSHSPVLRPESYVKWKMQELGYDWIVIEPTLGLHDFEQSYKDIFRKLLVRAYKSPDQSQSLLRRAIASSTIDTDFLVATWGIRVGLQLSEHIELDAKQWESETNVLLIANNMREKEELDVEEGAAFVDRTFADLALQRSDRFLQPAQKDSSLANRFYSRVWQLGWLITRAGLRIQRLSKNRISDGAPGAS